MRSIASAAVAQSATTLISGSASRRRTSPRRNRLWSSSTRTLITSVAACCCIRNPIVRRREFYAETASRRRGLVPEFSVKGPHNGARNVQPEPGALRIRMKRLEQPLRALHAAGCIGEPQRDGVCAAGCADLEASLAGRVRRVAASQEASSRLRAQCTLRVLTNVQHGVQKAVVFRADGWERVGYAPDELDSRLLERGLDDNAQLIEQEIQVYCRGRALRRARQLDRCNTLQPANEGAEGAKILVVRHIRQSRQVHPCDFARRAEIPHRMRD